MLQDVAIKYIQFHPLPERLGEPTALSITAPFAGILLSKQAAAFPPHTPSTNCLKHLKMKEGSPGKQVIAFTYSGTAVPQLGEVSCL